MYHDALPKVKIISAQFVWKGVQIYGPGISFTFQKQLLWKAIKHLVQCTLLSLGYKAAAGVGEELQIRRQATIIYRIHP